jgi:hypothetical protein
MEKYISHNLELIQEEPITKHRVMSSFETISRSRQMGARTSYKDYYDIKRPILDEIRESYQKAKEFEKSSALQKQNQLRADMQRKRF